VLTTPPYYPGTDYARALEVDENRFVILHKDAAIYDSIGVWLLDAPPYDPGSDCAVDFKLR